MHRIVKTISAVAVASALLPAGSALAEPARNVTLSEAATVAEWDSTGQGILATQDAMDAVGCQPGIHTCDDTLIHVTAPGTLSVQTSGDAIDSDLQLFTSDEKGTVGEELGESAAADPTPNEAVGATVEPGWYIARIDYAISTGAEGGVHGKATLTDITPTAAPPVETATPAPQPQPQAQPAPQQMTAPSSKPKKKAKKKPSCSKAKTKKAKKACAKKAKKKARKR